VPPVVSGRVRKEHAVDQVWVWVVLAVVVVALLVMGLVRSRRREPGDAASPEGSAAAGPSPDAVAAASGAAGAAGVMGAGIAATAARAEPADKERDGDTRSTATPENGRQGTTTADGSPDAPTSGGPGGNGAVAPDATPGGMESAASAGESDRGRAAVQADRAADGMPPAATGATAAPSEGAGATHEAAAPAAAPAPAPEPEPEPEPEPSVRDTAAPADSALAALDAGLAGPAAGAAAAGAEVAAAAITRPGRHPGSVLPAADGSSPSVEFVIKVNEGSRRYHTPESPFYVRTRADFWFRSVADAEKAGFAAWNAGRTP
jgi:hypothetical protein